ncbi:MAG TPA: PspC domain-containing protein [Acidimicrobiia bacterium]
MNDAPPDGGTPPPGAPAPGTGTPAPRRVTRSRDDRICCGVAAGIARYLGVDPVLVRLGFVLAALLGGVGILAYVAGWLLIPEEPLTGAAPSRERGNVRQLVGFAVLGIGLLVVLGNFDLWIDEQAMWAVGLIAIGGGILWVRGRDARAEAGPVPPEGLPSAPTSPPAPPPAPPAAAGAPPPPPSSAAPARPPASLLGPLALCALFVWAGVAFALDATGAVDVGPGVAFAGGLIVIGVALVVGAWRGRARWLVAPGIALALGAAAAGALDLPLAGGIGERDYQPATFGVVDDHYELGIGSLDLDLRDLDFRARDENVRASVGIGELRVWVPDDVRVIVDAHVGFGELVTFGEQEGGVDVDDRVVRPGLEGGGTLRLDLEGGFGSVKVLDADTGGFE